MQGKRYSTEQKIRLLRAADAGRAIVDVCREAGISEQTFHRWKRVPSLCHRHGDTQVKRRHASTASGFTRSPRPVLSSRTGVGTEERSDDTRVAAQYNNIRPHRSLALLTPLEFAAQETAPDPFEINFQGMDMDINDITNQQQQDFPVNGWLGAASLSSLSRRADFFGIALEKTSSPNITSQERYRQ